MLLGNGYTISNLTIESSSSNVGFFATLEGMVKDVKFENANIKVSGANENVGILCGTLQGRISNVYTSGIIEASKSNNVGGVIGYCTIDSAAELTGLGNKATIHGADYVGGIIGNFVNVVHCNRYTTTITNFENSGAVSGANYIGGLFGKFDSHESGWDGGYATVNMSSLKNTGDIEGKTYIGGLIGHAYTNSRNNSSIIDSNSTGVVKGNDDFDKYIGKNENFTVK